MFYFYFEARQNQSDAPLLIWLTGAQTAPGAPAAGAARFIHGSPMHCSTGRDPFAHGFHVMDRANAADAGSICTCGGQGLDLQAAARTGARGSGFWGGDDTGRSLAELLTRRRTRLLV